LLGYEPGSKAYRLLDLDTRSIHKSHHVRFVELLAPATTPVVIDAKVDGGPEHGAWWDNGEDKPDAKPAPSGVDAGVASGGNVSEGEATPAPSNDTAQETGHEVEGLVGLDDDHGLLNQANRDPNLARYYDPSKNNSFIHQPLTNPKHVSKPTERTTAIPPKALFSKAPVDIQDAVEPKSVAEVLNGPHAAHWLNAMNNEWESLLEKDTFRLAKLPPGRRTVGCKWVLTLKHDANGKVARFKACLVAQGFSQVAGDDYSKTFASVVKFSSIRLLCTYAATHNHTIHHIDVKTTYLNRDLDEEIYMRQPSKFDDQSGRHLELLKAI
jgi:hypothetical protein